MKPLGRRTGTTCGAGEDKEAVRRGGGPARRPLATAESGPDAPIRSGSWGEGEASGGIGGAVGVRVSVSGPRGLSGVAGWAWWVGPVGLMACWAGAPGGSFLVVSFLFCFVFVSYCFIFL